MPEGLPPVLAGMFAMHLHEVEGDVLFEQDLCEFPRHGDKTVLGAAVQRDVGEVLRGNLVDEFEGIVGIGLLGGGERSTLWGTAPSDC